MSWSIHPTSSCSTPSPRRQVTPRLEDRVVVAYGRSQARPDLAKLFDEMESVLGAGESPATAAEVLRFVVEHNCHALSRHRKENLDKAVAAALGEGPEPDGATSDLLRRLAAKPTPLLNGAEVRKLRLALLPLLAADPLRGLLGTKLSLRRTRRSRGIAAHHAGLKEVEERLAELGEIVEAARDLLDKRRA